MKRLLLGLAFVLPLGCEKKEAVSNVPSPFDQKWIELAKAGAQPLFVESEVHGSGLLGEVRRAVDPPIQDTKLAAVPTILPGPLPDADVADVIRRNLGGVKGCYQLAEREGAGSGKAIVSLEISPSGSVATVNVDAPAFSNSKLPNCLSNRARAWTFPKFTQGPKHFAYPFIFSGG